MLARAALYNLCQHAALRRGHLSRYRERGRKISDSMSIANSIRAQIPPIHPEGYPFIGGFALATIAKWVVRLIVPVVHFQATSRK